MTVAPAASPASGGQLPGVPHNLGAGAPQPTQARGSRQDAATQYRANGAPERPAPGTGQEPRAGKPRQVDKIFTILLLALGSIGALQFAAASFNMSTTFALLGDAPGIDGFTGPDWLPTTGKIFGIIVIAIYALTLIFSIRRMRSGKLTFWVPLAAGALAFLLIVGLTVSAILGTPELMTVVSDPDQAQKLMEYLQELQTL